MVDTIYVLQSMKGCEESHIGGLDIEVVPLEVVNAERT